MLRLFLRHLPAALFASLIVGTISGGVEGFSIYLQQKAINPPKELIITVSLTSAAYWMVLAPFVSLAAALFLQLRKEAASGVEKKPLLGRYLLLFLYLYGMLAAWIFTYNQFQENPFAPKSLLMDAGIVTLFSVAALVLMRVLRVLESRWRRFRMTVISTWIVLLAAIAVIGYIPWGDQSHGSFIAKKPTEKRPNVLVVMVDTLRADHLGCYGYKEKSGRDTSPSIDALAADGVLFTNCLAQSSWTRPSVTSILTATVPAYHRVAYPTSALTPGLKILPNDMGQLSYKTAMLSASPQISKYFGFGLGVDCYRGNFSNVLRDCSACRLAILIKRFFKIMPFGVDVPTDYFLSKAGRYLEKADKSIGTEAKDVNQAFLGWLDEVGDRRFCAYLHYMEPHTPYNPDPPFDTLFQDDYDGDPMTFPPHGKAGVMVPLSESEALDSAGHKELVALYDGEIAQFSREFEKLVSELKKRGLYDDMLIFFISDHGEEFYDHKGWEHGHSLYNELIHVPLIVKFPRGRHSGTTVSSFCQTIDMVPTLFDYLDVETWKQVEGGSLLPLLNDEPLPDDFKWRTISSTEFHTDIPVRSYIEEDYKLIHVAGEEDVWLLYDLAADPEETRSVAEERPEVFNRMRRDLEEIFKRYDQYREAGASADIGSDLKDKLKALGYGGR